MEPPFVGLAPLDCEFNDFFGEIPLGEPDILFLGWAVIFGGGSSTSGAVTPGGAGKLGAASYQIVSGGRSSGSSASSEEHQATTCCAEYCSGPGAPLGCAAPFGPGFVVPCGCTNVARESWYFRPGFLCFSIHATVSALSQNNSRGDSFQDHSRPCS